MTRIAVVGAGLAGLAAAKALSGRHEVTLFEKSRGVGGRIATRYADPWEFDHGAQFFTARSQDFRRFLDPLLDAGAVAIWNARFVEIDRDRITSARRWDDAYPHYVGSPRMNALGKYLALDLDVRLEATIAAIERRASGWRLLDADAAPLGEFDWVVSTAPAQQASALLPESSPLCGRAARRKHSGCYALMLGFDAPLDLDWHAALVRNADISWISVNSSKPGRPKKFSLLVHSTNAWADAHIDADRDTIQASMLESTSAVIGVDVRHAHHVAVHRWRYANIEQQTEVSQVDVGRQLAACGDWFVRGRVEGAFTSAVRLVAELNQLI